VINSNDEVTSTIYCSILYIYIFIYLFTRLLYIIRNKDIPLSLSLSLARSRLGWPFCDPLFSCIFVLSSLGKSSHRSFVSYVAYVYICINIYIYIYIYMIYILYIFIYNTYTAEINDVRAASAVSLCWMIARPIWPFLSEETSRASMEFHHVFFFFFLFFFVTIYRLTFAIYSFSLSFSLCLATKSINWNRVRMEPRLQDRWKNIIQHWWWSLSNWRADTSTEIKSDWLEPIAIKKQRGKNEMATMRARIYVHALCLFIIIEIFLST